MIDKKHFNKLISIHPRHSTLNVLHHGLIKDNTLYITDLDYNLILDDIPVKSGVLSIPEYRKTKDFKSSLVKEFDKDEFPNLPEICQPVLVPVDVFYNISAFSDYVSVDFTTRIRLTGIHYDFKNNRVCGTDGHRLHKYYLDGGNVSAKLKGREFIVPARYATIIQYIVNNFGVDKIKLYNQKDDKDCQYITIDFSAGTFMFRCIEGPYPDYGKVIPKFQKEYTFKLTAVEKISLLKAVTTMLPYTNAKTNSLYFMDEYIIAHDVENGKIFYTKIKGNPFRHKPSRFNGQYLKQILKDIPDSVDNIGVYSRSSLGATVFRYSNNVHVLMPLRVSDDFDAKSEIKKGKYIVPIVEEAKSNRITVSQILALLNQNKNKTGRKILELINN